jgi:hypothetical protein
MKDYSIWFITFRPLIFLNAESLVTSWLIPAFVMATNNVASLPPIFFSEHLAKIFSARYGFLTHEYDTKYRVY